MKYKSLKPQNINVKHINTAKLSLDMSRLPTDVGDNCLTAVKNVIYKDGALLTRAGLFTAKSGLLDVTMCDGAMNYKYYLTDIVTEIEGEQRRLAYSRIEYDERNHFIFVFGIGENQNVRFLGYMLFGGIDDTTFYSPQNVVFYTGKPQNGGGIYALVMLKNVFNNSAADYYIYEINKDFNDWNRCISDYVPTVYINGTGNGYGHLDWKFSSSPKLLEPRNLLNGDFYAYYSADGVSTGFRLPFTNIDNSPVICRFYQNAQEYIEWRIEPNSQIAAKEYMGRQVLANIDRPSGTVFFSSGSSYFALPVIDAYRENNLRIFATKTVENGFSHIASSRFVTGYKDKWLFAGGKEKNKIYYVNYDMPLYFPDITSGEIGTSDEGVTSIVTFSNRIIASTFKGIYEIDMKNGGDFNAAAILGDNGKIFKKPDIFTARKLSGDSARDSTMAICGEKLLWFGKDNSICSLSKNGSTIEKISDFIEPILREIANNTVCYAAGTAENYILSYGNSAVIINPKNKSGFYWEFPNGLEMVGIVSSHGDFSFLYRYKGSNECYVAGLYGEKDVLIKGSGYNLQTSELPIYSGFTLKCFDFDDMKKKAIKRIDLRLVTKAKSTVTVGDRKIYAEFDLTDSFDNDIMESDVTLLPDISGVRYAELKLSSDAGIKFGGADIYFC